MEKLIEINSSLGLVLLCLVWFAVIGLLVYSAISVANWVMNRLDSKIENEKYKAERLNSIRKRNAGNVR